jgi:hypothetical protein
MSLKVKMEFVAKLLIFNHIFYFHFLKTDVTLLKIGIQIDEII